MATSQYVGARYVPLFAEPAQWDINKQYEPLTIVLDHGNSYTSRQFVPAGIELTNDAFWALTGNYNAQVEQYRQEVRTYDDRITTAQTTADNAKNAVETETSRATAKESEIQSLAETNETDIAHLDAQMAATSNSELLSKITTNKQAIADEKSERMNSTTTLTTITTGHTDQLAGTADSGLKSLVEAEASRAKAAEANLETQIGSIDTKKRYNKVLFVGDSWGNGYYGGEDHKQNGLANYIGTHLNAQVVNLSVSGSGFATTITPFETQISNATAEQVKDVDLVVIAGGQNDADSVASSRTPVVNGAINTFKAARTRCPNADIHVFPVMLSYGRNMGNKDTVPALDTMPLARVKTAICEAYATCNVDNIYIHNGCHRWGWLLGYTNKSKYVDDAWHLTAAGYDKIAQIMANLVIQGGDFWPSMCSNLKGYNGSGNVTANRVVEENGMINITVYIYATAENAIGTKLELPYWASRSTSTFYTGVSTTPGLFLSADNDNTNETVNVKIQGAALGNAQWIFFNASYPAGY